MENLISKNLNYWKSKKWNKLDLYDYLKQNKNCVIISIIKTNITVLGNKKHQRLKIVLNFLQDIIKIKPNLNTIFLLNLDDECYQTNINIYNLKTNKIVNNITDTFEYGICNNNPDLIKIEESIPTKFNFPIFSFSKTEQQQEVIIFPHTNLIQNNFMVDKQSFEQKNNNIPLYRFSNIRANTYLSSRFELVELSYKYPKLIDCKGGSNKPHPKFNDYILDQRFIKLYQNLDIIDKTINNQEMMKYFNINNFIDKKSLIQNKYLICNDSYYNLCEYCNLNSVLFRYQPTKTFYYEDFIFTDLEDIIIFNQNNFESKFNYAYQNPDLMVKFINKRKSKVNQNLIYNNLVQNYAELLFHYSKLS